MALTRELATAAAGLALIAILGSVRVARSEPPATAGDLDTVRKGLEAQSELVTADEAKVAALLEEIRSLDKRLLDAARGSEELSRAERALETDYRERLEHLERAQRERAAAQAVLETRLADVYKRGRLGSSRALVQAATSTEPLRIARYLAAISQADSASLDRYDQLRREHRQALAALDEKKEEIDRTKAELAAENANYERARGQKTALLGDIEKDLAVHRETRERLTAIERELQKIMVPAPAGPVPSPEALASLYEPSDRSFVERKGTLDAPVSGTLSRRFGEREERGSRVQGLLLESTGDRRVVAVAEGEVVFAGPFPGLGKTIIVNHGGRFHTVYSRLASLAHEVGQKVRQHEVIGTLSSAEPELHFELRSEGKAVDPLPWFAGGEKAFVP